MTPTARRPNERDVTYRIIENTGSHTITLLLTSGKKKFIPPGRAAKAMIEIDRSKIGVERFVYARILPKRHGATHPAGLPHD